MDASEPEAAKAAELLKELFPRGAIDVTHRSFEDEAAAVQLIVKDLEGRFAGHAQALGLTPLGRELSRAHAAFAGALAESRPNTVSYDVVSAAENTTQELLAGLVIGILAKYRGSDDRAVARRTELLAPILEQDARIAESLRRRRPVADVDPETGHEVPPAPPEA